jgi:hypothetical protein
MTEVGIDNNESDRGKVEIPGERLRKIARKSDDEVKQEKENVTAPTDFSFLVYILRIGHSLMDCDV